eukprot:scaffold119236_cov61-Phaeocystis_antarctica.AAC.2
MAVTMAAAVATPMLVPAPQREHLQRSFDGDGVGGGRVTVTPGSEEGGDKAGRVVSSRDLEVPQ